MTCVIFEVMKTSETSMPEAVRQGYDVKMFCHDVGRWVSQLIRVFEGQYLNVQKWL
jgi:hypothetical protein